MRLRFSRHAVLFALLVAVCQFVVGLRPGAAPSAIRGDIAALGAGPPDIVFFGDSSDWFRKAADTDVRPISAMIRSLTTGRDIVTCTHASWHMGVFLAFCRYFESNHIAPQEVVVTVNMRSFSPEWYRRPEYQFPREQFYLSAGSWRAFLHPLAVFKVIRGTTHEAFAASPVYYRRRQVGTVEDFRFLEDLLSPEVTQRRFVFRYMYALDPHHERVRDMVEIATILRSLGTPVLFYVTPIDVEHGEVYLPGAFRNQLQRNVAVVERALADSGAEVLDLSEAVPGEHFAWATRPDEHLDQVGRMAVAERIARTLTPQ